MTSDLKHIYKFFSIMCYCLRLLWLANFADDLLIIKGCMWNFSFPLFSFASLVPVFVNKMPVFILPCCVLTMLTCAPDGIAILKRLLAAF